MASPGSVSFKAYLRQKGNSTPKEVRRFGIEQSEVVSYNRLMTKLQQVFPSLGGRPFSVSWKDSEGDYIIISSDEELLTALTETSDKVRHLYLDFGDFPSLSFPSFGINPTVIDIDIPVGFGDAEEAESGVEDENGDVQGEPEKHTSGSIFTPKEHFRVICDGCNSKITSHRYKCVECPDFDLCCACESRGLHSDHIMVRIPLTNCLATRHPYFMKGLGSLKDAVRKIQHRRKKNERRWSKVSNDYRASSDYWSKIANNYFMDWDHCMQNSKCDKSERKGRRDQCHTASAAQGACSTAAAAQAPPAPAAQAPPAPAAETIPQPSTSKSTTQNSCPAAAGAGLISSFLNPENISSIQRFFEQISPVPEAIMQEVARSLAGTNLNANTVPPTTAAAPTPTSAPTPTAAPTPTTAPAPTTAPMPKSSNPSGPSPMQGPSSSSVPEPMAASPELMTSTSAVPVAEILTPQSTGSSESPVILSPRSGSAEPDAEGWMVVEPQGGDIQNNQPTFYPKLPAVEPTPVNASQSAPLPAPIQHRDPAVQTCLELLGRMGYNVDDQFLVELAEAHRGDVSKVLDVLH